MSCAGKGYGTNPQSDQYLYSQFYSSIVTSSVTPVSSKNCRKYSGFYPSFTPILGSLSHTTSASGAYKKINVSGSNFLPQGTTSIKFGPYNISPTYLSSFNLSFEVPADAIPGIYSVQVINLYNGNFSTPVNQSYPGNQNFSNSISYTVT